MRALKMTKVGVGVPLHLVGAPLASSSLPVDAGLLRGLRQVRVPAILFEWIGCLEGIYQILVILPNGLVDPLGLKLLEM